MSRVLLGSILGLPILAGCLVYRVDRSGLDRDILHYQKEYKLGLLWYMGSEDGVHYVKYVYGMFQETRYRIAEADLPVEKPFPFTNDDRKWQILKEHDDPWPMPLPLKARPRS